MNNSFKLALDFLKKFSILKWILLSIPCLCVFLFSLLSQTATNSFYGSWQYKVKVREASIFNASHFLAQSKNSKEQNKQYFIAGKKITGNSIYYTGFFKLNAKPKDSFEVLGSYYPATSSNPSNYAPLKLAKVLSKKDGSTDFFWYVDFKKSSIGELPYLWLTKASYNPKQDKLSGTTIAFDCSSNKCKEVNIAEWQADRITDINFFSHKNHKTKGLISALIHLFDKRSTVDKIFLHDVKDTDDELTNYSDELAANYLRTPLQAMLKAEASAYPTTEPDQALEQICRSDYCALTAHLWKGGIVACNNATIRRRGECCSGDSPNGLCTCTLGASGAASSTICSKTVAACQVEIKTLDPSTGRLSFDKKNVFNTLTSYPGLAASLLSPDVKAIDDYFGNTFGYYSPAFYDDNVHITLSIPSRP
jgi:hypothetical protein